MYSCFQAFKLDSIKRIKKYKNKQQTIEAIEIKNNRGKFCKFVEIIYFSNITLEMYYTVIETSGINNEAYTELMKRAATERALSKFTVNKKVAISNKIFLVITANFLPIVLFEHNKELQQASNTVKSIIEKRPVSLRLIEITKTKTT